MTLTSGGRFSSTLNSGASLPDTTSNRAFVLTPLAACHLARSPAESCRDQVGELLYKQAAAVGIRLTYAGASR